MNSFYRLVNPLFEQIGQSYNTIEGEMSPRLYRSVELSPLFCIAFRFWQKTGVQLSTSMDAMLNFQDYLHCVQEIEEAGIKSVPTNLFNNHELLSEVKLDDLKELMFDYYDLYNEKGLVLDVCDLPYVWEFLWETIRREFYPNASSRMLSLYLYDNIQQAKNLQRIIDPYNTLHIVRINTKEGGKFERYDAGWLDTISVDCTFKEYIDFCKNYWEGKESTKPNWEYLYTGNYSIASI